MLRELVVISGKGGTGKTSLVASFAALAGNAVMADCDVDAADLHLVLAPQVQECHEFRSGRQAVIRGADCTGCGKCLEVCRFGAVLQNGSEAPQTQYCIDPTACEGCGVCVRFCPVQAIDFPESVCGEWYVSQTRFGPMAHARLGITAENSGKLVTVVRTAARDLAEAAGRDLILVDGPPGIGCPVIASLTGATFVLAVTEPTLSGQHDLERVLGLARHFGIPAAVSVNKWDVNPQVADQIETLAQGLGAKCVGRLRYDPAFTEAQVNGRTVVEESNGQATREISNIWDRLLQKLS